MNASAQNQQIQVLVTDVGSYLGASLAESLLAQNCAVFGIGHSPLIANLLEKPKFTLLELDLAQPLPSYLPHFGFVFYLLPSTPYQPPFSLLTLAPATTQIIGLAKEDRSQVLVLAKLASDSSLYEYLAPTDQIKRNLKLFLVGDLYGPGMPLLANQENELANLLFQAVKTDKVILSDEGLAIIYPAYISDVVFAINKFVFGNNPGHVHCLVSESATVALTAAYEIQNAARVVLGKELGLFFGGPAITQPQSIIKISNLDFSPKVKLAQGLKTTFEYFVNKGLVARPQPQQSSRSTFPMFTTQPVTSSQQLILDQIMAKPANKNFPLTFKIPQFSFKPRIKTALFLVLIFLLLFLGKTIFDIYWGVTNLKKVQGILADGDFTKAKKLAQRATSSFKAATSKTQLLLLPVTPIFPKTVKSFNLTLAGVVAGGESLFYFSAGGEVLVKNLAVITTKESPTTSLDLETPLVNFKKAYLYSAKALSLVKLASEENSPDQGKGILVSKLKTGLESLEKLNSFSQQAADLVNLTGDFTGIGSQKTYLLLLQNNAELRPGGGFIGNFGLVEFEKSRLKNITVEDIYTIDGQLQDKIEPPRQLKEKLGISQYFLRDSNWSGDFELNATVARDFFRKETGKNVDGVIAVDLTLVQNLLAKTGPIYLADYSEEITAQNLFERGEYYAEIGFFPGSTQKRDFFGSLSRALISRLLASFSTANPNISSLALLEVIKEGIEQKHLLFSLDNPNLASFIRTKGWNHPLPPVLFNPGDDSVQTRDFLAISEANLGANKANRFLERKISYEMTIGRDADLVSRLTITYTNASLAEAWPAGKYLNFLRVYIPPAASLFEFRNGGKTDLKEVEITNQGNLTVLATYVEVPVKSTHQVSFSYRLPKNIKLEKVPYYHLYVQKQPGTEKDLFEFKFNLPGYLVTKSVNDDDQYSSRQNLTIQTDLATDRQFQIEVAKK